VVLFVRRTELEPRHVDSPGVSKGILCQAVRVNLQLMRFDIHLRVENNKLLLEALSVWTQEVVFAEMYLKSVVVYIVLLLPASLTAIADVTSLVLISAMRVELVVAIKARSAESAFWVPLEPALVDGSGIVIAELLVFLEIGGCE
jgi:hypothetical protein